MSNANICALWKRAEPKEPDRRASAQEVGLGRQLGFFYVSRLCARPEVARDRLRDREVGVLKNEMCTRATWHGKGTGVRANL